MGIDDAHLLDEVSAALLHQLALRGLVFPVVSVRCGEPVSDAITALWKDNGRLIAVQPLPPPVVDELLDRALGHIDPITRRLLHRSAAGNPLLLRELLVDARESGVLAERAGVWRWRGPMTRSPRLAELVSARLRAMDLSTRRVLRSSPAASRFPCATGMPGRAGRDRGGRARPRTLSAQAYSTSRTPSCSAG